MAVGSSNFSVWCDFIEREFLSNELPALIDSGIVSGVTSNPVIFKNAILNSKAYAEDKRKSIDMLPKERYEFLAINDIKNAAKLLLSTYKANEQDGFVSIEVNPLFSDDFEKMAEEAKRLYKKIGMPNVMIKIPATEAGYETIKELIIEGININATLIFSPQQAGRCLQAIENGFYIFQRRNPKKAFPQVVMSIFVSRFDRKLDDRMEAAGLEKMKFGVMNASYIYQLIREQKISNVRCLFASTGVSDPSVSKSYYITKLLYKNAVNTAPLSSIESFIEMLDSEEKTCPSKESIQRYFEEVEARGIVLKEVYASLLEDGLGQFNKAHKELLESLRVTNEEIEEIKAAEKAEQERIEREIREREEAIRMAEEEKKAAEEAAKKAEADRIAKEQADKKAAEEADRIERERLTREAHEKALEDLKKQSVPVKAAEDTKISAIKKDVDVSVDVKLNKAASKAEAKRAAAQEGRYKSPVMRTLEGYLRELISYNGSDLHIKSDAAIKGRVNGEIVTVSNTIFKKEEVEILARELLQERYDDFANKKNIDFTYKLDEDYRFRVNIFRQTDGISSVFRAIPMNIPSVEDLCLPLIVKEFAVKRRGLILVTGPTGSGKSTTLAAVINLINQTSQRHIITIEDPIEFIYKDEQSIINQRSVGQDAVSFSDALIASLREDPDVIMVGEMRDVETIRTAIRAAETGHLVLSTLHTLDAKETIGRIISMFNGSEQNQIRQSLASVLQAVVSQRLVRRKDDKGRIAAIEILIKNERIEEMIKQGREGEIKDAIEDDSDVYGSQSFNQALLDLYTKDLVSYNEALYTATSPTDLKILLDNYDIERHTGIKRGGTRKRIEYDDEESGNENVTVDMDDNDILSLKR
ncbi:MAG: transaldolase [Campylobacteraceae bacterium]|jgi:twitching motility protein PilT|nr:transaldolase [Campylobacteraceae bacterium]